MKTTKEMQKNWFSSEILQFCGQATSRNYNVKLLKDKSTNKKIMAMIFRGNKKSVVCVSADEFLSKKENPMYRIGYLGIVDDKIEFIEFMKVSILKSHTVDEYVTELDKDIRLSEGEKLRTYSLYAHRAIIEWANERDKSVFIRKYKKSLDNPNDLICSTNYSFIYEPSVM